MGNREQKRISLISIVPRPPSSGAGFFLFWMATLVVAAALFALGWMLLIYPDSDGPRTAQAEVVVDIAPGTSVKRLAGELEGMGVVSDARLWSLYMRLRGLDRDLRTGKVRFPLPLTPEEVARYTTTRLGRIRIRVLIPEGFNRFEIAERLEEFGVCDADDFLEATEDDTLLASYGVEATNAEGYLFPDTYEFVDRTKGRRVVERMLANWTRHYDEFGDENAAKLTKLRGWTMHDIVIMASIVEKEAAVPGERSRIAGVFWNRLRSKKFLPRKRLQADPTVAYGCVAEPEAARSCVGYDGTITRKMLEDRDNRYNTYRHSGLPPGPISNPGTAALLSVIDPERHDYFYFVARGGGRHQFSRTLGQHNRAIRAHLR